VETSSFFIGNTDADNNFLTYIMPYHLLEGLEERKDYEKTSHYENMKVILDKIDIDDANPIIIEYEYK
jgi:uncharacterized lipoprotein YehR (DUF1307 family)